MTATAKVLREVTREPGSLGEITRRLRLPKGTVSGTLAKLMERGMVIRVRHSQKSSEIRMQRVRGRKGHVYEIAAIPGTYEVAP